MVRAPESTAGVLTVGLGGEEVIKSIQEDLSAANEEQVSCGAVASTEPPLSLSAAALPLWLCEPCLLGFV